MSSTDRPRIVISSPLSAELCATIERELPEFDVVTTTELQPPTRHAGDWAGIPGFERSDADQQKYEELLESATVLFGIPDESGTLLGRVAPRSPHLRWVQTMAAGGGAQVKGARLGSDDLDRITFTTAAGVHGQTLAEFALFGVLAGAKNLPRIRRDQDAARWPKERWMMRAVADMTVLILGMGGIGARAAQLFSAVGSRVWGASRSGRPVEGVDRVIPMDQLKDALGEVDAVVVTLPGTEATKHLVGPDFFGALKDDAVVTNVGRGSVIDESALLKALDAGKVAFAALDVTEREPLAEDSPLWSHERVLLTPHTAALSAKEPERIVRLFVENARRWLKGEELENVVDTVDFY